LKKKTKWTIDIQEPARHDLRKIDRKTALDILKFLSGYIADLDDPRSVGDALTGPLGDYWRYRYGDYRIVAGIQDNILKI